MSKDQHLELWETLDDDDRNKLKEFIQKYHNQPQPDGIDPTIIKSLREGIDLLPIHEYQETLKQTKSLFTFELKSLARIKPLKIYCGHAISGLSYDLVVNYYDNLCTKLNKIGYTVFHPMLGKNALRNEVKFRAEGYGNPESTNHAIKARDKWMVQQADIILMDFTSAPMPSIGMSSELAWADAYNKHTVTVVQKDNPNYHAFVLENSHIVYEKLEKALEYLEIIIQG